MMSRFSNPVTGSIKKYTLGPLPIKSMHPLHPLICDYTLISHGSDYIYNINFHTHPLLIGRDGDIDHYRLSSSDVDYIQIIIDGFVVSSIRNIYREEPIINRNRINGIYTSSADFFNNDPIVTGLLTNDPIIRIVFWRMPVAPFWFSYDVAMASHLSRLNVKSHDGNTLSYCNGSLRKIDNICLNNATIRHYGSFLY